MQVWERPDVDLEKLSRTFMTRKRSGECIGFPDCLLVEALDERLDVVGIPSSEDLTNDLKILLSGHVVPSTRSRPFLLGSGHPTSFSSASAFSSQNRMSISRYIAVAVVKCSWASCRLPVRR